MIVGCVDVGSTFTKVAVVDVPSGKLLATAAHPTTVGTDVLHGLDAALAAAGVPVDEVRVCSSAGGGLRLAVIGYERLVTAQAGHRVGLSAGAKVVHVAAGRLDRDALAALRAAKPDVVLLVGGTDGGDEETIAHNARRLAAARWRVPVVLAGNAGVRDELAHLLRDAGVPVTATDNVLPRIGVLAPGPARLAIREVFLRHVIGGKKLSKGPRFASLVRAATPDAVLAGVELWADEMRCDLAVVDIGGATTDVYSVLTPDAERAQVNAEVAGTLWRGRTVEGDLGMRWSAVGVYEAALAERMIIDDRELLTAARLRTADPDFLAVDGAADFDATQDRRNSSRVGPKDGAAGGAADRGTGQDPTNSSRVGAKTDEPPVDGDPRSIWWDRRIATLAATIALRRHARGEVLEAGGVRRGGVDLRDVRIVVGSGGVLRHSPPDLARAVLAVALRDTAGGWVLPRDPAIVIDSAYVLAAAGLLAEDHPEAALGLLRDHL
ncbi:hypothetical protein F4553_007383 [Allocatelliglobosispora scoriae]|uniref:Glutamate mutase n=1 Tax=Allocatelliglobosispora scoriae TaxID=643052 RepID=A0A841C3R1_9ACTN|nr:glutamate mutase L [Allocatelliglobosispora scoriae]MBB5873949.1 hypothetical protein [Allocatelliglobosispora scoriae]